MRIDATPSQVSASQICGRRQTTDTTHYGHQTFVCFTAERLGNIQVDGRTITSAKRPKEMQKRLKNKADEPSTSLRRDNQSNEDLQKRFSRVEALH